LACPVSPKSLPPTLPPRASRRSRGAPPRAPEPEDLWHCAGLVLAQVVSKDEAMRIARCCYVKASDAQWTKERVAEFRQRLCEEALRLGKNGGHGGQEKNVAQQEQEEEGLPEGPSGGGVEGEVVKSTKRIGVKGDLVVGGCPRAPREVGLRVGR